ncbi:hypothetical protein LTS10_006585 [Elasticomyces elasticus]|nr:hypothetical protein LTS10_006585 [Elasticomyces elasticus]
MVHWTNQEFRNLAKAVKETVDAEPKGTVKSFWELVANRHNELTGGNRSGGAVERHAPEARHFGAFNERPYLDSMKQPNRRRAKAEKQRKAESEEDGSAHVAVDAAVEGGDEESDRPVQSNEVVEASEVAVEAEARSSQASLPEPSYRVFSVQVPLNAFGNGKYDPADREKAGPFLLQLVEQIVLGAMTQDEKLQKLQELAAVKPKKESRSPVDGVRRASLIDRLFLQLGVNTLEYHETPDKFEVIWEKPEELQGSLKRKRVDSVTAVGASAVTAVAKKREVQPSPPEAASNDASSGCQFAPGSDDTPAEATNVPQAKQDDEPQTEVKFSCGGKLSVPKELETTSDEEMKERRQRGGPPTTGVFHLSDPELDARYTRQMLRTWDVQADEMLHADLYETGFL